MYFDAGGMGHGLRASHLDFGGKLDPAAEPGSLDPDAGIFKDCFLLVQFLESTKKLAKNTT